MEGWIDLNCPAMHRLGVELAISRSQVRRPNRYTTEPPNHHSLFFTAFMRPRPGVKVPAQHDSRIPDRDLLTCLKHRRSPASVICWPRSAVRSMHDQTCRRTQGVRSVIPVRGSISLELEDSPDFLKDIATLNLSTFRHQLKHFTCRLHWARSRLFIYSRNALYKQHYLGLLT